MIKLKFLVIAFTLISIGASAQVDSVKIAKYQLQLKNPCLDFPEARADEFHHTKDFQTPYSKPEDPTKPYSIAEQYDVIFHKSFSKLKVSYTINLSTTSPTAAARERGVIIILKNGKRINKPNAVVDTDVSDKGAFVRSTYITLGPTDIALLKASPIKAYELYDAQSYEQDSDALYKLFLCLLDKK